MTRKDIFGKLRLLPFFATFIIAGCTLMMDEVDEPEPEEVGFDEVATYENEYVTVNYQYQEGVKPVTDNVLEYVVESDDPNYLYFMDNIPEKWVPKVGEYLAGGCSPKIPEGLCNRVVSVTHENGMYIMELAPATEDEVYKELEITADFDYYLPNLDNVPDVDSTMTDEEKAKQVFDDWSIYNGTNADSAYVETDTLDEENLAEIKSRAPKDPNVEVGDKTEERTLFDIKFDTRGESKADKGPLQVVRGKLNEWLKTIGLDAQPYVAVSYKRYDKIHHHAYHNKQTKVDTIWAEITPTNDIRAEVGVELSKEKMPWANTAGHWADTKKLYDYYKLKMNDKLKNAFGRRGKVVPVDGFERDTKGAIRIAVPCCAALRIVFEPSVEPILSLGGAIGGHWKWTDDTYRQGSVKKGDEKTKIEKKVADGSTEVAEFFAAGYTKVGARARIGLGAEFARSVTITVGLGAEGYVEVGLDSSTEGPSDSKIVGINSGDYFTSPLYIKALVRGFIDLKVTISALGIFDLWSNTFELGSFPAFSAKRPLNYIIEIPEAPGQAFVPIITEHNQTYSIDYNFTYKIADIGKGVYDGNFVPKVKVYDEDFNHLLDIEADGFEDNVPQKLKKGTYTFNGSKLFKYSSWDYNAINASLRMYKAYCVPYLWRPSGDCYIYPELATQISTVAADQYLSGVYQTYGGELAKSRADIYGLSDEDFDYTDGYMGYNEYRFDVDFELKAASQMAQAGCVFDIFWSKDQGSKSIFKKKLVFNNPKSGKYTLDIYYALPISMDGEDDQYYVYVTPIYNSISTGEFVYGKKVEKKVLKKINNHPGESKYGEIINMKLGSQGE